MVGIYQRKLFLGLMLGGLFGMRGAGLIDRNIRKFVICSSFGISIMTFGFGLTSVPWLALVFSAGFGVLNSLRQSRFELLRRGISVHVLPKVYAPKAR